MEILDQHRKEIQQIIEGMASRSEMLLGDIHKKYKIYPPYDIYEEVQRVLKLNLRRHKFFKRDNLLESIIGRIEDFV